MTDSRQFAFLNREGPWQMGPSRARRALIAAAFFLLEMNDMSNRAVSFENTQIGAPPDGWTSTLTGSGDPKWTVETDPTAPSKSSVAPIP